MSPGPRTLGIQVGILLALWAVPTPARAADWFVRPNGATYGSSTGASWTHAWSGFSGISWPRVSPGDVIWVSGGTYTQSLAPAVSGTATNRVSIRRARSDAPTCTSTDGWTQAFDDQIHQVRQGIILGSYHFITISGRTTAAGGDYGWWIDFTGATAGSGIEWPNGSTGSDIVLEFLDVQGPGNITYSSDGRGIDDTPFSTATNHFFSHLAIHGWESGAYVVGMSRPTFEYVDVYDIMAVNWPAFHPNGIYTAGAPEGIVRFSRFHKGPGGNGAGEGIFFEQSGGSLNWQIYGNVFYDLDSTGLKAIEISSAVGAIRVFNNTFDNILAGSLYTSDAWSCTGAEWRNNLLLDTADHTCGSASNNVTGSSAGVFVNRVAHDYHIVRTVGPGYPRNAGQALLADGFVDRDPDGRTRGSDGLWDVGAYEAAAPPAGPRPAKPQDLQVRN